MKVLIACEESQTVCKAFRELGHEAYSCDILPCSGGHPEWHIPQDVLTIIHGIGEFRTQDGGYTVLMNRWDLIIAHPPCIYLSNAGAVRLYPKGVLNQERYQKGLAAKEFFMALYNAPCDKIVVENPVPSKIYGLPEYTQIIEPYYFGDMYKKKTCLWIKGLSTLKHADPKTLEKPLPIYTGPSGKKIHFTEAIRGNGKNRTQVRSKTFEGIAKAMAEQWGGKLQ